VGKDKENQTVLIGGSITGKKLPAFVIMKGKGKKRLKINTPENCVLHFRERGSYMDTDSMKAWIRYILAPLQRKIAPGKKGILLLDRSRGHLNNEIEKLILEQGCKIVKLPSNTTHYIQPMDLGVNFLLKHYYGTKWEKYQSDLTDKDVTEIGRFLAPHGSSDFSGLVMHGNKLLQKI